MPYETMQSSGFSDDRLAVRWQRLQRTKSSPGGELGKSQNDGNKVSESDDEDEAEERLILSTGRGGIGQIDGRFGECAAAVWSCSRLEQSMLGEVKRWSGGERIVRSGGMCREGCGGTVVAEVPERCDSWKTAVGGCGMASGVNRGECRNGMQ